MTSKKSLFNFGIFKNTIKRFKWGSFLYAIALFFSVPFVFMMQGTKRLEAVHGIYYPNMLIEDEYVVIPFLLAVCVPTVVAVLVYHFVHSQKQGIAVHSLPVTRKENYFSTIVASFVLMFAPVVLNTIILVFMSLFAYGKFFSLSCVAYWFFINTVILFSMFSVASFTAFISGHPAAHVVINAFVQGISAIIGFATYIVSDIFLYGFNPTVNFFGNVLIARTPVAWFYNTIENYKFFKNAYIFVMLAFSVLFYVLGYVLYKKRKIETSGDVIAFKIFKPIFKYSFVTSVAIIMLGIAKQGLNLGVAPIITLIVVFTLISYFAIEMLMNKSFKVFKLYKGYFAFLGAFAIVTLFFAYTSVFGYETRIPSSDKIVKSGVYTNYYGDEIPLVIDEKLAEIVREIHKELINDIPVVDDKNMEFRYNHFSVVYQLENGNMLKRAYDITNEQAEKYLKKMYESEKYKLKVTGIDNINIENVTGLNLDCNTPNYSYRFVLNNEEAQTFLKKLEKDITELDYDALQHDDYMASFSVNISATSEENENLKIFKRNPWENLKNQEMVVLNFVLDLNSGYKNAFSYLKEIGYCDKFVAELVNDIYICKIPFTLEKQERENNETSDLKVQYYGTNEFICKYKGEEGNMGNFYVSRDDLVKIDREYSEKMILDLFTTKNEGPSDGTYYGVYSLEQNSSTLYLPHYICIFEENSLPDYIKPYIQR